MRRISEREQELPETFLGMMHKIAAEDPSIISLSIGEPDFITPKPILQHLKVLANTVKKTGMTHYSSPQGIPKLREALAKKLKKQNKINANPENIQIGTGSQEVLFASLLATIDPTEEVIIPSPGYMAYIPAVQLVNGVPKYIELKEEDKFEINPDRLKKAITKKTEVIVINSPSNPTGNVLRKKTMEEIAKIAIEKDCYIFSDEAYEDLLFDKKHISFGSLNGMKDYVASFFSFSKSYAMCGFRTGYAVIPDKLKEALKTCNLYLTLCPPHISQLLALKALTISKSYIEKMRLEYKKRRDYIVKRLNKMNLPTPIPGGAFYALANIKSTGLTSKQFTLKLLKEAKVGTIPGSEFGPYGEGFCRFSYANSLSNIKKAMNQIEKVL